MAYNNYFPANYQPAYPQQNYQQNYASQQTYQNSPLIWVQGEAGAKSYMVAPNQTVVLFDSEAQIIYLKSADASGMPSIKVLDYTIRDNTPQKAEILGTSDFATKDDISAIQKEIDALKAKIRPVERTERKEKNNG